MKGASAPFLFPKSNLNLKLVVLNLQCIFIFSRSKGVYRVPRANRSFREYRKTRVNRASRM